MIGSYVRVILCILLSLVYTTGSKGQLIQAPEDFFGFKPGSDRKLFDYEQLIDYMKLLDKGSLRLLLKEIGTSPEGRPMYIAFISSEENIRNLDSLREINQQLAMNPDLTPSQRNEMVREGKVFVLATLSMHSTEVGPSQAAPLIAYGLLTATHPDTYFVPPPHDPIAENVDAGVWNWIGIFGSNMMKDMTQAGQKGVSQHYLFDDYWPGSTETCIWKNVIGFLTEAAGVQTATPIYVEENELDVIGKGLGDYKKSVNMPAPWPGSLTCCWNTGFQSF
ncbi:MAG: hypothetical protein D4R67_04330 [Bacteroidetes bacterium]|nr:MAG: hypothetical protein D4R67_04330 [Bacteroidota bacterium]